MGISDYRWINMIHWKYFTNRKQNNSGHSELFHIMIISTNLKVHSLNQLYSCYHISFFLQQFTMFNVTQFKLSIFLEVLIWNFQSSSSFLNTFKFNFLSRFNCYSLFWQLIIIKWLWWWLWHFTTKVQQSTNLYIITISIVL